MSDEEWKLGKEEPLKLIQDRKCPAYILQSIPVIGWNIYILFFKFHILLKKKEIYRIILNIMFYIARILQ